jgi:hypothetical protein
MKRTTKKLSGIGLELFLRRVLFSYSGIDEPLARQLAQDGTRAFASVRVRRIAWHHWHRRPNTKKLQVNNASSLTPPAMAVPSSPHPIAPPPRIEETTVPQDTTAFDPYALGLVPTFQREGADGLLAKLAYIGSIDDLRKMARAQQVALPAELRGADADINSIRNAIVEAVGKRIANRRAAAG